MGRQIRYAIVAAGAVMLASLVFIDFPTASPEEQQQEEITVATSSPMVGLKERAISVTIADTPEERGKGLSGRAGLTENEGMLFTFSEDGRYSFWMKDMLFAIDILWISHDGVVVDLQANVTPDTYPTSFSPREPARYVLELRAGWTQEYGVAVGDVVMFDGVL